MRTARDSVLLRPHPGGPTLNLTTNAIFASVREVISGATAGQLVAMATGTAVCGPYALLGLGTAVVGLKAYENWQKRRDQKKIDAIHEAVIGQIKQQEFVRERIEERIADLAEVFDLSAAQRTALPDRLAWVHAAYHEDDETLDRLKREKHIDLSDGLERLFLQHRRDFKQHHADMVQFLDTQPLLDPKVLEAQADSDFVRFQYRQLPLIGRAQPWRRLEDWLNQPKVPFSWWSLVGPGGVGKSRLAQEFALAHGLTGGGKWHAGFLRLRDSDHSLGFARWDQWTPRYPTLILVDYAADSPESINRLIETLVARSTVFGPHPVRLLLLDRPHRSAEGLPGEGSVERRASRYRPDGGPHSAPPLDLARDPLTDDDLWAVIELPLRTVGKPLPNRDETVKALRHIDPAGRPLFALFAALALRDGTTADLRQWDTSSLTRWIVDHEEKRWREAFGDHADKRLNLLALATLTGGLTPNDLSQLRVLLRDTPQGGREPTAKLSDFLPPLEDPDLDAHESVAGPAAESDGLAPLVPDILGGRFALDHLQLIDGSPTRRADRNRRDLLVRAALRLSPFNYTVFLNRVTLDFPAEVSHLSDWLPPTDSFELTDSPDLKSLILFNLGFLREKLSTHPGIAAAIKDYSAAYQLADAPIERRAKALVNRGVAWVKMDESKRREAIADFNEVIQLQGAPVEQVALAFYCRGITQGFTEPNDPEAMKEDLLEALRGDQLTGNRKIRANFHLWKVESNHKNIKQACHHGRLFLTLSEAAGDDGENLEKVRAYLAKHGGNRTIARRRPAPRT